MMMSSMEPEVSFTYRRAIWKTKSNFRSSSVVPSAQPIARCFVAVDLPIPPPAENKHDDYQKQIKKLDRVKARNMKSTFGHFLAIMNLL